jgi:hypothetical protein
MDLKGINRAKSSDKFFSLVKAFRIVESIQEKDVPCVFISHQKTDTGFASIVADFFMLNKIDVYFDENDNDLKFARQTNNHKEVTDSILKGIRASNYMLIIVSEHTYKSQWVPFEVGFGYDKLKELKILKHKELNKRLLPAYLKTTEILNGFISLDKYISKIKTANKIYETLEKAIKLKKFSELSSHPLQNVLSNE